MSIQLSNCGSDENGKYTGGAAGDQTGREWRLRSVYSGFSGYFHHSDANVRAAINEMAIKCAQNDHIGYDQNQRLTFYNQLKAADWYPENIVTDCEADCSSGVAAICIGAGHRTGNTLLQAVSKSMTTSTAKTVLKAAGFTYKSGMSGYVYGDFLWKQGHIATVVDTDALSDSSSATGSSDIKAVQSWLNSNFSTGLDVDGEDGPLTRAAHVKALQTVLNSDYGASLDVDSEWGPLTRAACPIIRKGAKGTIVYIIQGRLICNGYGTNGFDGEFGSVTYSSLRSFQSAHGCEVDGECGPESFGALMTN